VPARSSPPPELALGFWLMKLYGIAMCAFSTAPVEG
jgi:hypothetical protein